MSAIAGDLGDAVLDCSVPLVAIRFIPAPIVNGRVVSKPQEELIRFKGSFQPMTDRELRRLPEGNRKEGRSKIYTSMELKTVETAESRLADRVVYKGIMYQVDKVQDWLDLGGFFRIEVARMGQ